MDNKRNNGIDLLRVILLFMICLLHVMGHGGIKNNTTSALNFLSLYVLEDLSVCAIDCYALISGYFAKDKPLNYKRIIKLWITAFFYTVIIAISFYLINIIFNLGYEITATDLLHSFFPVSYGNWYFTAYFFVFFFSPIINKAINNFNGNECKCLLIMFIVVYSIMPLIKDNYFSKGASACWLLVLYCIGALIKKSNLFCNFKTLTLISLYAISCFITWLFSVYFDITFIGSHTSPSVLFSAIFLLLAFSKINIKSSIISVMSSLTFGAYLFHDNFYIREYLINDRFIFVNNYNFIIAIVLVLVIALIVFIASLTIDFIRLNLFICLRIDNLCEKIEKLFRSYVRKIAKLI